ncbi:hypothetical protein HYW84_01470 [Candidatus Peregrinibacteria bacterium]|nr:hypothetical protein [Candidatus Peregrinibacteria bacterium]
MNIEALNQDVKADGPTPEKRQDLDESAKNPDGKHRDNVDDKKEKKNDENKEQKDQEKKSMDEKILDCQKRADLRVSAYKKQLDDIDARNKKLDEQAKSASERTDFIANITESALVPGKIYSEETPVKPHASAMRQEQFVATAAEMPADQDTAKEKGVRPPDWREKQEKQAAAKEQPATAVAGQEEGAKQAAA